MRDEPQPAVMAGGSGRDRRLDGFEDDPFSPDWKGRSDGTIGGSGRASRMAGGQPRVVRVQHVRARRGQDGGMRVEMGGGCLLYTSPSPRDRQKSRMPSSA